MRRKQVWGLVHVQEHFQLLHAVISAPVRRMRSGLWRSKRRSRQPDSLWQRGQRRGTGGAFSQRQRRPREWPGSLYRYNRVVSFDFFCLKFKNSNFTDKGKKKQTMTWLQMRLVKAKEMKNIKLNKYYSYQTKIYQNKYSHISYKMHIFFI